MKNNYTSYVLIFFLNLTIATFALSEDFDFKVSELEITANGNIYNGINGGTVTTNNNLEIISDNFVYDKINNKLEASGNVRIKDKVNNLNLIADKIIYYKNEEKIFTFDNSATTNNNLEIISDNFVYDKINNKLEASGNVRIKDKVNNLNLIADKIIYYKNEEKIFTFGKASVNVQNKYFIEGSNINFFRENKSLSSSMETTIKDTLNNFYRLGQFEYSINQEFLKGINIEVISGYEKDNGDKLFFNTGFFDLKNKKFLAKDIKIDFDTAVNSLSGSDPRLRGISGFGDKTRTTLNKASFTTCQKTDKCPPWVIEAEKVEHDKDKKQIKYKNAWLKLYDQPVLYFPRFYHPDPTVKRQSGFLKPNLISGNTLGTALYAPYFYAISDNKDMTIKPRIFDDGKFLLQSEYRQKTKKTSIVTDFSRANGYETNNNKKRDPSSHLFANTITDLDLDGFLRSELVVQFQKTSNDTYLKLFDLKSPLLSEDNSVLESFIKFDFENEDYDFTTSFEQYETLSGGSSDRFQHVLPSYSFSKGFSLDNLAGGFNLDSYGNNTLKDTNVLTTSITNDLNYTSFDSFFKNGVKNNFSLFLKNLNTVGKNNPKYKSNPQSEFMTAIMFNSSYPLTKKDTDIMNTFTPKLSLRFSPNDMKNHKNTSSRIDMTNVYSFNRLGISDSFEEGASLTMGFNYKKEKIIKNENIQQIEDFFEMKLATVVRNKEEQNISSKSTLNKKRSNIFGQIDYNASKYISFGYDFSVINDLSAFEYNSVDATFDNNNFYTQFSYLEESGKLGNTNIIENKSKYNFDKNNAILFNTRRNKKLNLTEYYDLIYQYRNDCLTAGIEYKKKFYSDADIEPDEELFFSITIVPLGSFSPDGKNK